MKADYDRETDILTIVLREAKIRESDEVRPGVIDASKQVENADDMQFAVAD
ncbi:MAG: DUF2283 domain-containing protein [Chthoniobacterales bacterium]